MSRSCLFFDVKRVKVDDLLAPTNHHPYCNDFCDDLHAPGSNQVLTFGGQEAFMSILDGLVFGAVTPGDHCQSRPSRMMDTIATTVFKTTDHRNTLLILKRGPGKTCTCLPCPMSLEKFNLEDAGESQAPS